MLNETFSVVFKHRVEQLITQQIWTFYQSKHQPRLQRGCKPQTSSQITDYCVVQKRKREDVRQVRKSRFSSGLEKQKKKVFLLLCYHRWRPCFYPWGGTTAWNTLFEKSNFCPKN